MFSDLLITRKKRETLVYRLEYRFCIYLLTVLVVSFLIYLSIFYFVCFLLLSTRKESSKI